MVNQISLTESMSPRKRADKPCSSDIHSTDVQAFSYSVYTGGPGPPKPTIWKPADGSIQDFLAGNGWTPSLIAPKDAKDADAGSPNGFKSPPLSFASLAIDYTSIAKCECPKGKTEKSYRLHIGYDGGDVDVHFFEHDGQAGAKDISTRIPIGERLKKKESNAGGNPNRVTYTLTEAIYCACSDDDPCTFEFEISYEE